MPPSPIFLRSILILSIRLRLSLPRGLFPSGFPTNIIYVLHFPAIRPTCHAHLILLDLIVLIILVNEYELWSSSLCSFLQTPGTPSHFGPNILLNTLFSNILSLCYFLNIRDQVTHPHRTTGRIIFFVLKFLRFYRSQWLRGLRHELSSPAQILGSWIRIQLEAWISVCIYSVFMLSCVQVAALRRNNFPPKESYLVCERSRDWIAG
jgi:hypothetical protein